MVFRIEILVLSIEILYECGKLKEKRKQEPGTKTKKVGK